MGEEWDNASSTKDIRLYLFYNIPKGHINHTCRQKDMASTLMFTGSEILHGITSYECARVIGCPTHLQTGRSFLHMIPQCLSFENWG